MPLRSRRYRPIVAALVAGGAAELQLFDDGVAGLGEVGDVVVLEQGRGAAVDAGAVALLHHSLLSGARVAALGAGVDRAVVGVVDQRPDERLRRNPLDH